MNRLLLIIFCAVALSAPAIAQDISTLEKIGSVTGLIKTDNGITVNCSDNSQVRLSVLATDLIRIRASFTKAIPGRDHSWAIAKESWETPKWRLIETAESITISTEELDVVVHRSPLLIDFRDARTHEVINADEQPMICLVQRHWEIGSSAL